MTTMTSYLEPVPLTRLARTHLRIWRAQRGVVFTTALAVTVGVAAVLFAVLAKHGAFSMAGFGRQFASSVGSYVYLSVIVGAVAGAAPYRSHWVGQILVLAPRRLRWFIGAYLSVVVWSLGATIAVVAGSLVGAAAAFALTGRSALPAIGVLGQVIPVLTMALLQLTVGYLLGVAARGVAVPLVAALVLAPAASLLNVHGADLGRWIDVAAMTHAVAAGHLPLTSVTALCLWVVAPALVAVWRLDRSPVA